MNKLLAGVAVFVLGGAILSASCVSSDMGTGTTGKGGGAGTSNEGSGGSMQSGNGGSMQSGNGGSMQSGNGGSTGAGGMVSGMGGGNGGSRDAGGGNDATSSAGGATGAGGAAGSGAGGLMNVAATLDGQMLLGPCVQDREPAVCHTVPLNANCPTNPNDRALTGVLTTDKTITLGGTTGTNYSITLHVQGEVEAKTYTGGMDAESTSQSPKANGFCIGGTPTTSNDYNVYMIRVTNPGATTHQDYFFNSLIPPGVSNHTTYGIDYTATIKVQGGASLRLVADDSNCDMIKNCGPMANDGSVCSMPLIPANIEPTSIAANPTFDFTKAYNGQWLVFTVKGVTSP
jgi:hypothetical protein